MSERLGDGAQETTRPTAQQVPSAVELTRKLESLAESGIFALPLIEACMPDALAVHATGLAAYDKKVVAQTTEELSEIATDFPSDYDRVATGQFSAKDTKIESNRSIRRNTLRAAQHPGGNVTFSDEHVAAHTDFINLQAEYAKNGLYSTTLSNALIRAIRINYFFEPLPSNDLPITEFIHIQPEDLERLFGSRDPTPTPMTSETAARLRELSTVDLSKDTLDQRVDNLLKVIQVDVAWHILQNLNTIGGYGGGRAERARALLNKYEAQFHNDDFHGKVAMLKEMTMTFERQARGLPINSLQAQALRYTAQKYRRISEQMEKLVDGMIKNTYDYFGYEAPPIFNHPRETARPTGRGIHEKVRKDVGESAAVATFIDQLRYQIDAFDSTWHISAKQRKAAGLGDLEYSLITGYTNNTGVEIWPGTDKKTAEILVNILSRLEKVFTEDGVEKARLTKDTAVAEQRRLETDVATLLQLTSGVGVRAKHLPPILQVGERIDLLRANWPGLRMVIGERWPHNKGQEVIQHMEAILFADRNEASSLPIIPEPTSVEPQELPEEEALSDKIARQLDELILPPDTTIEDVEREFERIGIESHVTTVEWHRLRDLMEICTQFGGTLYRSKEGSLGGAPPYFVATFDFEGETYAVAESPIFGNATYIVAEKLIPGTWLEVLGLSKREARDVGAHRIIHSDTTPHGRSHLEKVYNKIFELHLIQP